MMMSRRMAMTRVNEPTEKKGSLKPPAPYRADPTTGPSQAVKKLQKCIKE
jgi:hypothetical protein